MANKDQVLALHRKGLRPVDIARKLGCLPQYASATIGRYQDPERYRGYDRAAEARRAKKLKRA